MSSRHNKAQVRRNEAWELWLRSRLNVIYWRKVIRRTKTKISRACLWVFIACAGGTVLAKLFGQPWLLAGMPIAIGLVVQILRAQISKKAIAETALTYSRWSDQRHDADRVWKTGEALGWGSHNVEKEVLQLRERDKLFHSLELDEPDRALLDESQRELWKELGAEYDTPLEEGANGKARSKAARATA